LTGRAARRAVVTGMGAVTPLGHTLDTTAAALARRDSAVLPLTRFQAGALMTPALAAEVNGFDARPYFRLPKALKLTDRRTRFAVAAAAMALGDAPGTAGGEALDLARLGVVIGSSGSDLQVEDLASAIGHDPELRAAADIPFFARRILAGLNPLWLLVNLPNMVSAHVAIQTEARGPNSTVMTDWIAGLQAVGEASRWIAAGEAEAVLAGGADAGVLPRVFAECAQAGLFPGGGFVLGEGAALFLVEDGEAARRRGAAVRGEIAASSSASSSDAGRSLEDAMRSALDAAGWRPRDVAAVACSAVHEPSRRRSEQAAITSVFGAVRVFEVTSRIGHTLAAAGAIDLALMLKSPPGPGERFLCVASGFLGQAAALAIEKPSASGSAGSSDGGGPNL
jgi:3-oxoacyl-[acyl-carrier-protein] synthase II